MKISIDLKSGEVVEEKQVEVIAGIDLGTTNSLIAYIKDGQATTIKTSSGKNSLTPSILYFDENSKIVVGDEAKNHLTTHPERTIFSVKRLMGKTFQDISSLKSTIGYQIIDDNKDALIKIKVDQKYYTPTELSAEILKSLKQTAENHLQIPITKAVITVPAYFNDTQRQATRDAGKLAGLDVLRIVNEPTAASLAYGIGLDRTLRSNIAVYDLGGGTFDISILHLEDGIFEVLSTHGNTFLGGDDFDKAIMEYWVSLHPIAKENLDQSAALTQMWRLAAEEAKKALTNDEYFQTKIGDVSLHITRDIFEKLATPFIQETINSCTMALKDAKLTIEDIDKVILVGGSTRMPAIKKELTQFFNQIPDDSLDPDEVVALGAAIQADILAGNRRDILLLDVTPLSLGIETVGGLMDSIIARNSKVPHRAGRQYTTSIDGQTKLRISVYQGERDLVEHNRKLGEFTLSNIPPMAAGIPKIEVQFILDADGILTVKAKELRSGTETSVEIKSAYGISEEEMAIMLIDSLKNAETDMNQRAKLESINEANNIILATDKFILNNANNLDQEDIQQLKVLNESLKTQVKIGSKDTIEDAMLQLNTFAEPLAHQALDININKALTGIKM